VLNPRVSTKSCFFLFFYSFSFYSNINFLIDNQLWYFGLIPWSQTGGNRWSFSCDCRGRGRNIARGLAEETNFLSVAAVYVLVVLLCLWACWGSAVEDSLMLKLSSCVGSWLHLLYEQVLNGFFEDGKLVPSREAQPGPRTALGVLISIHLVLLHL
jgi:hypothetical protein